MSQLGDEHLNGLRAGVYLYQHQKAWHKYGCALDRSRGCIKALQLPLLPVSIDDKAGANCRSMRLNTWMMQAHETRRLNCCCP